MDLRIHLRGKGHNPKVQAAGRYGCEHLLRRQRHQHKKRLLRRLLDHFQEGVARCGIHPFRQVHHHGAVPPFHRGKGQPLQNGARLRNGNVPLLALYADGGIQLVLLEIRIGQQQLTERGDELQRNGILFPSHGEDKMNVRVNKFLDPGRAIVKLFQEIKDDGKSPAAVVLVQHYGVRDAAALHH